MTSMSSALKAEPYLAPHVEHHSVTPTTDSANLSRPRPESSCQDIYITTTHHTSPCYIWAPHPSGTAHPSACYWTETWGTSCSTTVLPQHHLCTQCTECWRLYWYTAAGSLISSLLCFYIHRHGPRSDVAQPVLFLIFLLFYVLFVCMCVLNYCHWVATQLQLNISYYTKKLLHVLLFVTLADP
jgi:hypothetical protein